MGWDSGDVYSLEVAINKTSLKFNKIKTKFGVDLRANYSNGGWKAAMIRVRRLEYVNELWSYSKDFSEFQGLSNEQI